MDVCHLVEDDFRAMLELCFARLPAVDERLAKGDASRVLHRANVEFGDEELVVLVEGIRQLEIPLEEIEAGGRDLEDLVSLRVHP